jgi:hypothetical protein
MGKGGCRVMGKEWTDEEVQEEIRNAVSIVRADRFERDIRSRFTTADNGKNDPPNAPPPSSGNGTENVKKKKSLFWGVEE